MSFLNEMLPETSEAFGQMRNSIFKDGYLDLKTKELIAVASSVLMRCQFCVDAHSKERLLQEPQRRRSQKLFQLQCLLLPVHR